MNHLVIVGDKAIADFGGGLAADQAGAEPVTYNVAEVRGLDIFYR